MNNSKRIVIAMTALLLTGAVGPAAAGSPSDLRKQIAKAEQEYVALYNKLNTDPRYEVVCEKSAPRTGSLFSERGCKPRNLIQPSSAVDDYSRLPTATALQQEQFRKNVASVTERSPELQALAAKLEALRRAGKD
jgi:hypothetical protein